MRKSILVALFFVLCFLGFSLTPVNEFLNGLHWRLSQVVRRGEPSMVRKKITHHDEAFDRAFDYLFAHAREIRNKKYLTIIDYTKPSYVERMYIVNLDTFEIERTLVAHGKNSGRIRPVRFSNDFDSLQSCKGFFLTGDVYEGKHGTSLRLLGLERGINDNALKRGIVIHGAEYVSPNAIRINGGRLGLSWGCPAVPKYKAERIINEIKGGGLVYIHGE